MKTGAERERKELLIELFPTVNEYDSLCIIVLHYYQFLIKSQRAIYQEV